VHLALDFEKKENKKKKKKKKKTTDSRCQMSDEKFVWIEKQNSMIYLLT